MSETIQKTEPEKVFTNVSVQFYEDGTEKISIPKGMSYLQARQWLKKIEDEQNRTVNFSRTFKGYFPFDAMRAVYRALVKTYGFAHIANFQFKTIFGTMEKPPESIMVDTSYTTKEQIPWGPIEVSGIDGQLVPSITLHDDLPALVLSGEIKNLHRQKAQDIVDLAEQILKTESIYRGKAFEIDFEIFNHRTMQFDVTRQPKFMDTKINERDIILPENVHRLLDTALWTPIRFAEMCRKHSIPLKRGVLLAGKYGVGKTLAARVTAMLSERHGWTFIYLRNLEQLSKALKFAKHYEPAVIFAEDINRVVSGGRDTNMDALFNSMDGVERKNDEVMTVFTTNDLDDIHAGMLRPGRIDTVIMVTPPDAKAAERLIRFYGRGLVNDAEQLNTVGQMLAGQIPAIIREVVERSKLAAIADASPDMPLVVREDHLTTAALQLLEHAKLLDGKPPAKPDLVILGEALGGVIARGMISVQNEKDDDVGHGITTDNYEGLEDHELARGSVGYALDKAGRPNNEDPVA